MTTPVTRWDLQQLKGITPKLLHFFEDLFASSQSSASDAAGAVAATGAIQEATVLTLSSNAAFDNERILTAGAGITLSDGGPGGALIISSGGSVTLVGGFALTFNLPADTVLDLPGTGRVPSSSDGPYADDTAAAAAGVGLGEWYAKTGGTVVWRQV
jgi:hypothetical protein